jgi:hypothetical protein
MLMFWILAASVTTLVDAGLGFGAHKLLADLAWLAGICAAVEAWWQWRRR